MITRIRKPVNPDTIETYWRFDLCYGEPERPNRSGFSSAEKTLPVMLSSLFKYSCYYIGIVCVVRVEAVERCCANCYGSGFVKGKKLFQTKPCPKCKGQGKFDKIGEFPVAAHDNVTIINNV